VCPHQPTQYRLWAYVCSITHGKYHTDYLVLMELAWKTVSYSINSVLKSTRKIHYLVCSRYSSDSSVIHFILLRSKDVPFQDDTYFPFCWYVTLPMHAEESFLFCQCEGLRI
jgi:hypothetical protein